MPNLFQLTQLIDQEILAHESTYLKELSRLLLDRAPLEFMREFDTEQLLGLVQSAASFLEVRAPQKISLRAYSPQLEVHGWTSPFAAI